MPSTSVDLPSKAYLRRGQTKLSSPRRAKRVKTRPNSLRRGSARKQLIWLFLVLLAVSAQARQTRFSYSGTHEKEGKK